MNEYDEIAGVYSAHIRRRHERDAVLVPSLMTRLGSVKGLDILDLACGDGYFTELIRLAGARWVVGIDSSARQIELAWQREDRQRFGIQYHVADAAALPYHDLFDVVTAAFLLHYAKTREELWRMCSAIAQSLKPGGRFVTLNSNPCRPLVEHKKYGVTMRSADPMLREGSPITVSMYETDSLYASEDTPLFSFTNYYWSEDTYEQMLRNARFTSVEWQPLIVSREGRQRFPPGYWDEYIADSNPIVLVCTK